MVIDGFELPGCHPTVSLIMLSIAAVDFYDVATAPTVEPGETGCLEHPKESHPKQNGREGDTLPSVYVGPAPMYTFNIPVVELETAHQRHRSTGMSYVWGRIAMVGSDPSCALHLELASVS